MAEKAQYASEALSKALYNRMFSWVVQRINTAIKGDAGGGRQTVLGILDIYGFEIMQTNSFEQVRTQTWDRCRGFLHRYTHQRPAGSIDAQ